METLEFSHLIPTRNPDTQQKHRREVFWQITVPLTVGAIAILAACVLPVVVIARGGEVRNWADISLIWLILPTMVFALIPLALLAAITYGLTRLIGVVPGYLFRAQQLFKAIQRRVGVLADKSAAVVISLHQLQARLRVLLPRRKRHPITIEHGVNRNDA